MTLGIVLELNPPHNGHKYFIEEAKKKINPDAVVAIMSSSFTMRGDPSIMDKWQKASTAISMGCDFVFELPSLYALRSSDYFCKASISILASLSVTDIAFGVENDDINLFDLCLKIQDSYEYNLSLKNYIDQGFSYSTSSLKSLLEYIETNNISNKDEIIDSFTLPNNTLALGYLRALKNYPNINIHLIKRINNNYYDNALSASNISSAKAIREAIVNNIDIKNEVIDKNYSYYNIKDLEDKLFGLLKYRFATSSIEYISNIFSINEGLEKRIAKFLDLESYDALVKNVQTKRYSQNRIKRVLLQIILDNALKENDINEAPLYLRLLAFNENKKDFLKTLPKDIKKMIFSSLKDSDSIIATFEEKASKIYSLITNNDNFYKEEFKAPRKEARDE